MFTKKPEPSGTVAKLGGERPSGGAPDTKSSPFTDRPSPQPKPAGPAMGKMIPSIIGEDLTIEATSLRRVRFRSTDRFLATSNAVHCCWATRPRSTALSSPKMSSSAGRSLGPSAASA